ncbi:MAG: hypothetical protein LBQ52_05425 [Helicobacteraceae bacterium]|jgi:hypothetical protein|nr:hypothetical protein [Helicobacteraceae bacterium]
MKVSPKEHLNLFTRQYPALWKMGEEVRALKGKRGYPDWDGNLCYLPFEAWQVQLMIIKGATESPQGVSAEALAVAALGAWRWTQGIYQFNDLFLTELLKTEPPQKIQAEILTRIPQWSLYVDFGDALSGYDMDGFFCYISDNSENQALNFVLNIRGRLIAMIPMLIGAWSVEEAIKQIVGDQTDIKYSQNDVYLARILTSIVMYICSDKPDIAGHIPGDFPSRPQLTKTKRGYRMFPPDKPRYYQIGGEIGKKIEAFEAEIEKRRVESIAAGKGTPKRPHLRSAHWHGFWSGKKDGSEERKYTLKWLFMTEVGI